jgi:hypothetical protein
MAEVRGSADDRRGACCAWALRYPQVGIPTVADGPAWSRVDDG